MKASMEAQAKHQVTTDQTRLLTIMDLEKDHFRIALSHPTGISIGSSNNFNTVNVTMDVKNIPLMDKMNFHMQTRKLIVNDLTKTNAIAVKLKTC